MIYKKIYKNKRKIKKFSRPHLFEFSLNKKESFKKLELGHEKVKNFI